MSRDRNGKIATPEETRRHKGGSQPEGSGFAPEPHPEPPATQPNTESNH